MTISAHAVDQGIIIIELGFVAVVVARARKESQTLVKSTRARRQRLRQAEMPKKKSASDHVAESSIDQKRGVLPFSRHDIQVASIVENLGQCCHPPVKVPFISRFAIKVITKCSHMLKHLSQSSDVVICTGEEHRASRRARRCRVKIGHADSLLRKAIDIWSFDFSSVATDVTVSQIVSNNDQEIGPFRRSWIHGVKHVFGQAVRRSLRLGQRLRGKPRWIGEKPVEHTKPVYKDLRQYKSKDGGDLDLRWSTNAAIGDEREDGRTNTISSGECGLAPRRTLFHARNYWLRYRSVSRRCVESVTEGRAFNLDKPTKEL